MDLVGAAALVAHKPQTFYGNYRRDLALAPILWRVAQGFFLGPAFDLLGRPCATSADVIKNAVFRVAYVSGVPRAEETNT